MRDLRYTARHDESLADNDNFCDLQFKNLSAMTEEKLHSKAEIAIELAHRDMQLERLRAENDALKKYFMEHIENYESIGWHGIAESWQAKLDEITGGE